MMNVKPNVKKIFEMSGVLEIIPIIQNVEDVGGLKYEKCI